MRRKNHRESGLRIHFGNADIIVNLWNDDSRETSKIKNAGIKKDSGISGVSFLCPYAGIIQIR
jgi:hypothetical protein